MAWWSPAVLGGDLPLDLLDELTRQVGIYGNGQWFNRSEHTRKRVLAFGASRYLAFIGERSVEEQRIAAQIVGLLHVASATPLPPGLRTQCLWGCITGHLAWKAPERRQHLSELAGLITLFSEHPSLELPLDRLEKMLGV